MKLELDKSLVLLSYLSYDFNTLKLGILFLNPNSRKNYNIWIQMYKIYLNELLYIL